MKYHKSALALMASINNFLTHCKASNRKTFFWTLTFKEIHDFDEAARAWKLAAARIQRRWGKEALSGIRVFELHKDHGIHIHFVIDFFLPVTELRACLKSIGFGRNHVKLIRDRSNHDRIAQYMAKYLIKMYNSKRPNWLKGKRFWANIGYWRENGVRVKDIELDSPFSVFYRQLKAIVADGEKREKTLERFPKGIPGIFYSWDELEKLKTNKVDIVNSHFLDESHDLKEELEGLNKAIKSVNWWLLKNIQAFWDKFSHLHKFFSEVSGIENDLILIYE